MVERVSRIGEVDALTARGVVIANAEVTFSSDLTAPIQSIPLRTGQPFKKGEVLVAFDCGRQQAELRGAEAEEYKYKLILENREKLLRRKAAGAFEVAEAKADLRGASAQTDRIRKIMRSCTIKAPFDGSVLEKHADAYEMPGANAPLLTVVDDSILELDLIVPSRWLRWMVRGTEFEFEVDETGNSYRATVLRIGAKIDAVSQTIRITGRFSKLPETVLPGMSGVARFSLPTL